MTRSRDASQRVRPASPHTVQFGLETVAPDDKTRKVTGVFETVAGRYDLMNDLMSFGAHRVMKRIAVESTGLRPGGTALDLAGGTGDMAALLAQAVGREGCVVLTDINASMMNLGRDRLIDRGCNNVLFIQADAEALPYPDESYDAVTIAFGLRNLTDKERGLREMHRVVKPGGRIVVLEFSKARNPIVATVYGAFQALWPTLGRVVVGDASPYRYLVDSITVHPNQAALRLMIQDAGFTQVRVDNLLSGIVAIHSGVKP